MNICTLICYIQNNHHSFFYSTYCPCLVLEKLPKRLAGSQNSNFQVYYSSTGKKLFLSVFVIFYFVTEGRRNALSGEGVFHIEFFFRKFSTDFFQTLYESKGTHGKRCRFFQISWSLWMTNKWALKIFRKFVSPHFWTGNSNKFSRVISSILHILYFFQIFWSGGHLYSPWKPFFSLIFK